MSEHCKHCWHYSSGFSTGAFAQTGTDTYQCCFCGVCRNRKWRSVPDPKHGQYCNDAVKRYEDE